MVHCLDICLLSDLFHRAPVILMPQQSEFSKAAVPGFATYRRILAETAVQRGFGLKW
jgi:hypothetical protein